MMLTTVVAILALSSLVTAAPSHHSGGATLPVHQHMKRESGNCHSQNTDILPRAITHIDNAFHKGSAMLNTFNMFFKTKLSSCSATFVEDTVEYPHYAILLTYSSTNFDVGEFGGFIPAFDADKRECSDVQHKLNSTISYLECSAKYMGSMLLNLTTDINSAATTVHSNNSTYFLRETVYDAYKNTTWVSDLKLMAEAFPCAEDAEALQVPVCDIAYNSIEVELLEHDYSNSCVSQLLSSESDEYLKQVVVLAQITEILNRMKTRMESYKMDCLV